MQIDTKLDHDLARRAKIIALRQGHGVWADIVARGITMYCEQFEARDTAKPSTAPTGGRAA